MRKKQTDQLIKGQIVLWAFHKRLIKFNNHGHGQFTIVGADFRCTALQTGRAEGTFSKFPVAAMMSVQEIQVKF